MEKVWVSKQDFDKIVKQDNDEFPYYTLEEKTKELTHDIIRKLNCEEWFVPESGDKVYLVSKSDKVDFTKYDYLPDMVGFMLDVKYLFDNHNSPNDYPFSKVELGFSQMFEKGMVQAEEVKSQIGETFKGFMPIWIEAFSLMKNKDCTLGDFFNAIAKGLYVKDILPFVANVVKEKANRPTFKLNEDKLETLVNTTEFDSVQDWFSPFTNSLIVNGENYVVDKRSFIIFLSHIVLNMNTEFECGGEESKNKFKELLNKYRRVFNVDGQNEEDNKELSSKLSFSVVNKLNTTHSKNPDGSFTILKDWYESGYILGSPEGQKLF